jgi:hypothetical protein
MTVYLILYVLRVRSPCVEVESAERRAQQDGNWDDLESADPHVEDQHQFCGVGHLRSGDTGVETDVT